MVVASPSLTQHALHPGTDGPALGYVAEDPGIGVVAVGDGLEGEITLRRTLSQISLCMADRVLAADELRAVVQASSWLDADD